MWLDLILVVRENKKYQIIHFVVPSEENINKGSIEKILMFQDLIIELKRLRKVRV